MFLDILSDFSAQLVILVFYAIDIMNEIVIITML